MYEHHQNHCATLKKNVQTKQETPVYIYKELNHYGKGLRFTTWFI